MIVSTLDCALLLCDDFTGSPIPGSGALFHHHGGLIHPVRRPDGVYLFLRGPKGGGPPLDLRITLPGYLPRRTRIDTGSLPAGDRLIMRRMVRAHAGAYRDCEWLHGAGPPGREVLAIGKADAQLRFAPAAGEPDGDGPALHVSGYTARRLEGLRYAVELSGRKIADFVLGPKRANNSYRLLEPARWPGGAEPIPLRRAYRGQTDERGNYSIPVDRAAEIEAVYAGEEGRWDFLSAAARS